MSISDDDVFESGPPPRTERVVRFGVTAVGFLFVGWRIVTDASPPAVHVVILVVMSVLGAVLVTPAIWMDRHRIRRVVLSTGGFSGVTVGGRPFDLAWSDVRETSIEVHIRTTNVHPGHRSIRVDTTTGALLVTDALPRFDALVGRIHAATPHAFHQALPTRLERWLFAATPAATPPPGAPGSGSASA